ncbi:rhomboid family intramembrane serine protease [Brevundimonas sp. SL130]|uniref:rhomboid family intramembrane serine protease n=1 Tax=Brevundimonas sp. SL130 TaxID=2995143 RepID=UPI00226CA489|nr:rhomboid family intramembrane serine protease [Brevundimonas sp. SL130]WAC60213.1 rhomboid family intramembrane serine protease [Brevundimonas sp. SL130]
MDETAANGSLTALQRASSGRLRTGVSITSPRTWKSLAGADDGPGLALAVVLIVAFVLEMLHGGPWAWGLSAQALAEGRWHTLASHMVAHGGLGHIVMNLSALLTLSPIVVGRLGSGLDGWFRYAALMAFAGLLGAAAYLALHLQGNIPLVGASGAICGLWGLAARIESGGGFAPLLSRQVGRKVWAFTKVNVVLVGLFFLVTWGHGGLAWEAHLGGFMFGLLVGPMWAPPLAAVREH